MKKHKGTIAVVCLVLCPICCAFGVSLVAGMSGAFITIGIILGIYAASIVFGDEDF